MTCRAAEGACAFAWRTYLLLHKGINEDDDLVPLFIGTSRVFLDAGEHDFNVLQVAALRYLKKLDELNDDGKAQLAASEGVGRRSFEVRH